MVSCITSHMCRAGGDCHKRLNSLETVVFSRSHFWSGYQEAGEKQNAREIESHPRLCLEKP